MEAYLSFDFGITNPMVLHFGGGISPVALQY